MALSDFIASSISAYEHKSGFNIVESPTGNCQLFSVKYFNDMLRLSDSDEDIKNIIKDFKALVSKPHMLIDVAETYEARLDKLFRAEQFIVKTKYTNRNTNTRMMICLIHI